MSDSQQWTLSDLRAWSTDRLSNVLSTITTGLTATSDGRRVYSHDLQRELRRRQPTTDDLAAVAHGAYFDDDWAGVTEIERELWRNVVKAIRDRTERHPTPASPDDLWAMIEAYADAAYSLAGADECGTASDMDRCHAVQDAARAKLRAALGLDGEDDRCH